MTLKLLTGIKQKKYADCKQIVNIKKRPPKIQFRLLYLIEGYLLPSENLIRGEVKPNV